MRSENHYGNTRLRREPALFQSLLAVSSRMARQVDQSFHVGYAESRRLQCFWNLGIRGRGTPEPVGGRRPHRVSRNQRPVGNTHRLAEVERDEPVSENKILFETEVENDARFEHE